MEIASTLQIFMKCVAKTNFGKADMLAAHRDGKMVSCAFTLTRNGAVSTAF